ncbi:hypothetical protein DAPPUDRAFT_311486 [Daphnia pulex]|uniref:Phosphodiesterase n=1 Tax=Daphnia pulex TaxID=6669 RepID=E9FX16_DAPPU|nr:hypothetical protein DAPPUDRAFT_311486 [Daphnia pulex]|eukprot:EFX88338.1 hypothetical protein DAPPUDRAFT_311486 [Daphnia pulex]
MLGVALEMAEVTEQSDVFLSMVQDIATELDLHLLCHKILVNVGRLTAADRGSLFLVESVNEDTFCDEDVGTPYLVPKLFDVTVDSDFDDTLLKAGLEAQPIPLGSGIAGHVALTKTGLRIVDAYRDERFLPEIDKRTGYVTHSILCLPILNRQGGVVGVAQMVNKKGAISGFTSSDEEIFRRYLCFAGIGIQNARLFLRVQNEKQRNQVLLGLAESIFQEQTSLKKLVQLMMSNARNYLHCRRIVIYVFSPSEASHGEEMDITTGFEYVNDEGLGRSSNQNCEINLLSSVQLQESPFTHLARFVAQKRQVIRINEISDYSDCCPELAKLLRGVAAPINQFLSLPIYNARSAVVGVVQLLNKVDGKAFTSSDKLAVESFALFCGMAIHNTQTYEEVSKLSAKQKVAIECLSYHSRANEEDVEQLENDVIPSTEYYNLTKYDFIDFELSDLDTCKVVLRMFIHCDLINIFRIPYKVLCRWILSVKKNYRPVKYHNWRHALNVAQTMFALLKTGKMEQFMTDLDILSLLIACLCHDLDHRGTNNAFQSKVMSPLAVLYSTSTMEHHHLDQCTMILSDDSNNILQSLSPEQYRQSVHMIEHAILSTDLAVYFRKKSRFITMVENGEFNWQDPDQKSLLCGMMMTGCDVGAIAKPWSIQHRIAKLVAEEFFEQGDMEKLQLNETPIAMFDRDEKDNLPKMQIGFIDSICLPLYRALSESFPWVKPVYETCLSNREQWKKLSDLVDMGLTWIDHPFIEKPVEHIVGSKEKEKIPLIVTDLSASNQLVGKSGNRYDMDHLKLEQPKSILKSPSKIITKSILKLPKNVPASGSAPVSPHQEPSKHLTRMRSMSLNSPTELVDIKPLRPSRDYTSKLCSIS